MFRKWWNEQKENPEALEIAHHAIVATFVAAVLLSFEIGRLHIPEKAWAHHSLTMLGLAILALALGFFLLLLFEFWWRRKSHVKLDGLDRYIDGKWIYATHDGNHDFTRCTLLDITSSGFSVKLEGFSYRLDDLRENRARSLHFTGSGSPIVGIPRISLSYIDTDGARGVAYLDFRPLEGEGIGVEGGFTGSGAPGRNTRCLSGRKLTREEIKAGSKDHYRPLLLTYLEKRIADEAYSFKRARRIDGDWIEVVKTRDNAVVGGSLVTFAVKGSKFEVSGRFYRWEDLRQYDPRAEPQAAGRFHGIGYPVKNSGDNKEMLRFTFDGYEQDGDFGGGDFVFWREDQSGNAPVSFTGGYWSKIRGECVVEGRQAAAKTAHDRLAELVDFVRPFARAAGGAPGAGPAS